MAFKQWLESAVRQGTSRWVDPALMGLAAMQRRGAQRRGATAQVWRGLEPLESRVLMSTYTVNTTSDAISFPGSGTVSLRDAVNLANTHAATGPNTIVFAPSVSGTITLTQGELELTAGNTTITGPGTGTLTVSGNTGGVFPTSRVFGVDSGVTAIISGLTLSNGLSNIGGGIFNQGTLTLTNAILSDNASTDTGGGICNSFNSLLTINNSFILGNEALRVAGGISNDGGGVVIITNSTISGNDVGDHGEFISTELGGGGIVNVGGGTTLTNCVVTNNTCSSLGGGILNYSGSTTLTNCDVANNISGSGGGINNYTGIVTVTNSTISGNSTDTGGNGGGIDNTDTLTVTGSTFFNNIGYAGGGIFNGTNATYAVSGTTTVINSTFTANDAAGSSPTNAGGGAICNSAGTLTVTNSTISRNSAINGDGVYNGGTATLNNTIVFGSFLISGAHDVSGNQLAASSSYNLIGDGSGGLVNGVGGASGNILGTTSHAIDPDLGPLQNYGGPTQTMPPLAGSPALAAGSVGLIPGGVTTDQRGLPRTFSAHVDMGAVESSLPLSVNTTSDDPVGPGLLTLRDAINLANAETTPTTITFDPTVFYLGSLSVIKLTQGPLELVSGNTTIKGDPNYNFVVTVSGQHSTGVFKVDAGVTARINGISIVNGKSDIGGGIFNSGTLTLDNTTLDGNSATSAGGNIYNAEGATATVIDNSDITDGSAQALGGGITNYGTFSISDSIISANSSGATGGGIFTTGTFTATNCQIGANTASDLGGGIENEGSLTITNSTFNGNSVTTTAAGSGNGGGIWSFGSLTINGSTFTRNSATGSGGAIYQYIYSSTLALNNCQLSNNVAVTDGGGIYNSTSSAVSVANSTLADNSATGGAGGIFNATSLTVTGSTLSGNVSNFYGGAIYNSGAAATATMTNSTMTGNTSQDGGGILDDSGAAFTVYDSTIFDNFATLYGAGIYTPNPPGDSVLLKNTILAGNLQDAAAIPIPNDVTGALASSSSYNLISDGSGGLSTANHNILGTHAAPIDPKLGPLVSNGGPTPTMALLPGSPAIDTGSTSLIPVGVTTDQRGTGFPRVLGSVVDIGAFESFTAKYDFGTATSPLAAGYTRVADTTAFSAALGYGWQSGTIKSVDRGTSDPLTRDFNYTPNGTFGVNLPNGSYTVKVILGDTGASAHDQMGVFLEGAQVDTVSTAAAQIVTRSYGVNVTDGQLNLKLQDLGGADPNVVIEDLEISPAVAVPLVTINQAAGQADPVSVSPINFTVVFSEPVSDFATGDVGFTGSTAGGTLVGTLVGTVTGSGTTYNVAVTGMTSSGTVIATIAVGKAHDAAGNPNPASTSTDNSVTFNVATGGFSAKYDFGTAASALAPGYTRVTDTTTFSAATGFGWQSGTIKSVDRGTSDPLTRDFNYTPNGTFGVNVPNGAYSVKVIMGDTGASAHDQMGVFLEGTQVDTVTTAAAQVVTKTYTVTVTDGQLNLKLQDLGGADPNAVIEDLEIVGT